MNTVTLNHSKARSTEQKPKHWTRQFWPWFLILLPASGVVASMFTITLAVQNAPTITDRDIGRFARDAASLEHSTGKQSSAQKIKNPK